MIEQLAGLAQPVLDIPYIRRTRRNHGLEHAAVHVLSRRLKNVQMLGRSNDAGFVLYVDAPQEQVEAGVREALRRMQAGEHSLAVHPGCGTSRLTTGMATALTGIVSLSGVSRRDAFNRLPFVMLMMMLAVLASEPMGIALQRYFTTEGDPGDLRILSITHKPAHMPLTLQPTTLYTIATHST
jgi:hypothetical protein